MALHRVAEVGVDMTRFPDQEHFISWAGLCPRNDESAGKRRSTRLRKGDPWLKTTLLTCAWAAARAKGTYLNAHFLRLKGRRGAKKAACAVAASILTAIYHMIKEGLDYKDLGPDHSLQKDKTRMARRLANRLRELGLRGGHQSSCLIGVLLRSLRSFLAASSGPSPIVTEGHRKAWSGRATSVFREPRRRARLSLPVGRLKSLQHGVVLGVERLQFCIFQFGSGSQDCVCQTYGV